MDLEQKIFHSLYLTCVIIFIFFLQRETERERGGRDREGEGIIQGFNVNVKQESHS
jgi:hypothetical protein